MNRPLSAIAGGVTGISVMSLLLLLLNVQTRDRVATFEAVARFVGLPDQIAVGFALFVVAGAVAWPLLFVALEERIPGGPDPATRGMAFGAVLWVFFAVLGRGDLDGPLLLIYLVFTLISHLAYGFVLGLVYGRLSGATPAESPRYDRSDPSE